MNRINSSFFLFVIILLFTVGLFSCKPETCEEVVPQIEFVSFETLGDTGKLTIRFKDCDGDIGLSRSDTLPPYEYNLFLDYFEFKNGEWNQVGPLNPPYYYRIPEMETNSSSPIQEGEIDVNLIPYYLLGFSDTIRYEVYLLDSALNKSNVITTPTILAPID